MNDERHEQPDRPTLDLLYSRVAAGEATESEWNAIVDAGGREHEVWRDLAYVLRDEIDLGAMAGAAGVASTHVPVPEHDPVVARLADVRRGEAAAPVRVPSWLGWAAAAVLFLALIVNAVSSPTAPLPEPQAVAGVPTLTSLSTDEAFRAAYELGREDGSVLSPEPRKVILQTREIPSDAGFEIIFIEQVVRKATVPTLYKVQGVDERGRPSMIRMRPDQGGAL